MVANEDKKSQGGPERFFKTDHLLRDLKTRAVRGSALFLGSQVIKTPLDIAGLAVLARILTPADYGLFAMVIVFIGFVAMFKDLGFSLAVVQRPKITHAQVSTLLWINVGICTGLMIIVAAMSPGIAWIYHEPALTLITLALSVEFILGGLTVQHQALLRRQMRFSALIAIELTSLVLGLAVAIIAALNGAGYWALVLRRITDTFFRAVGVWALCGWRPGLPVRGSGVWSMVGFGFNITGFSLTNYFTKELDKFLIGVFTSAHALGLYDRSNKLAFKPTLTINMPLREVAVPALSRIVGEPERYRGAYLKFLQNIAIITMPGMAFMVATADWLIYLLMGDQWIEATRIFILLGVAALLIPVGNTNGWLFVTQDRTKDMLIWGFIDGAIKVISVVIGIFWGVMGVAWAVAIRTYAQWPLQCWFVGRKGPVGQWDFYRAIAMPGLASVLIIAVIYYYRVLSGVTSAVTGIITAFALAVVITVVSYLIFPAGRSILKDLWSSLVLLFTKDKGQSEG